MARSRKISRDPFAIREGAKYKHPIASREFILETLEGSEGPLSLPDLHQVLGVQQSQAVEALKRRLRAMERDGQIIRNRQNHYLPVDRVNLVRGRVIGHTKGFGFLVPDDGGEDIYLPPYEMRTLMHGDRVVVRPERDFKRNRLQGKLVEITQRHNKQVVGRYYRESGIGFVVPDDKRMGQDIMIPPDSANGATNGQFVVVSIIEHPNRSRQAIGKIVEILGDHLAPGMEIDVAIRSYDIPHQWPEEALREAGQFSESSISSQVKSRRDLRALRFVTIDGCDARDFDDAVYCEPRETGWRLWVAIADVSHYVLPDSALDVEARKRGTSVYFPEHVVPMLPEQLSNELCSLTPDSDRLCMVCEMFVSTEGALRSYRFYEAVMRSRARLTYDEVQQILYKKGRKVGRKHAQARSDLKHVQEVYRALQKQRKRRGAIDFDTRETFFEFDRKKKIKAIIPRERLQSHRIIEECMICANMAAGRFIARRKLLTLYRIHDKPTGEKTGELREFLHSLGIGFTRSSRPRPEDYLSTLKRISHRKDRHIIELMLLRSMAQAVYSPDNIGHFGLALPRYAHFTSPIRRYPDLIVHRTIRHVLAGNGADSFPLSENDLKLLGEECSMCERRADEATRDVEAWLKCEFMLDKLGKQFSGVIQSVRAFGFFVMLDDILVDGLVHVTTLSNDYYHFDEASQCLFGEQSKKRYRLGDLVNVIVSRVSLDERKIDLVLSDFRVSSGHKKKRQARRRK